MHAKTITFLRIGVCVMAKQKAFDRRNQEVMDLLRRAIRREYRAGDTWATDDGVFRVEALTDRSFKFVCGKLERVYHDDRGEVV
jgi:hypothetical protein